MTALIRGQVCGPDGSDPDHPACAVADINGDGSVTNADRIKLVNCILAGNCGDL